MVNYLRNDIYNIWLDSPGLTTIETIDLLRKRRLLDRPQKGLKETLEEFRSDFDKIPQREKDSIDNLDQNNTPIGSNPFMEE